MKRLHWIAAIALLWAQESTLRLNRVPLQPRGFIRLSPQIGNSLNLRTTTVDWLLPNQDYAIVPDPTNDTDYANDTLLSNGTGPNTRNNPPAACVGTFFDSLEVAGAYVVIGNERIDLVEINPPDHLYLDGKIAERYDIAPDLGGTDRTVTIKGIAAWIVNFSANPCAPTLATPTPDDGDNAYTITYALYPVRSFTYGAPFYSPSRQGTIPGNTPLREVKKPIDQVRIGNAVLGDVGPQCPTPAATPPSITEVFDFVYFPSPVDVTDSTSYYVVVGTERYNVNTYSLTDTLYFLYGPLFRGPLAGHPCLNGDTVRPGRSLISWALYDTTTGQFSGLLSQISSTLPDWAPTHSLFQPPLDAGLNWVAFPIVYARTITSGIWLNSGMQRVMTPYPNPTTECFYMQFEVPQSTQVRAFLYTTDGRLVKVWNPQPIPAGDAKVALDVQDVPTGTYLLRTETDFGRSAFQVTVLH